MPPRSRASDSQNAPAFEPLESRLYLADHPVISEFLAVNEDGLEDQFGKRPDWIEIYNPTDSTVDLTNWRLRDEGHEWRFPSMTLGAGKYLVVFASDRNLRDPAQPLHTNFKLTGDGEYLALADADGSVVHEYDFPVQVEDVSYGLAMGSLVEVTLVGEAAPVRVLVPTNGALGSSWTGEDPFDDSAWRAGSSGVGYDTETTYRSLIRTDVGLEMYGLRTSAYMRFHFQVDSASSYGSLKLRMQYDDGYAAYLNGVPIDRQNADDPLEYDSRASDGHDDNLAVRWYEVDVSDYLYALSDGDNVLAIHGLNVGTTSTDFLIVPQLIAGKTVLEGGEQYFATPTPRGQNTGGTLGVIADTHFSTRRGFLEDSFDLTITTDTEGAEIRYTLNGKPPTATTGEVYQDPIPIRGTAVVRAAAFKPGYLPTNVDTQTYLFLGDVIRQSPSGQSPGPGWPTGSINGQVFDYGMDPDVVYDARYSGILIDALEAVPTISLVTDLVNLFDPASGIYVNARQDGREWERPTSVELINPDGTEGFQIDAGLRIRGGYSRSDGNPKHAFRLLFRDEYGDAKLQYPLFGEEGADEFDNIDLRCPQNYSWSFHGDGRNTFLRDVFSRDVQREMGQPYTRSRYYHLYINGVYWGLYQSQERSEASYGETYFGDDKDDYDVVKVDTNAGYTIHATDGNLDAWYDLWEFAKQGFADDAVYFYVRGMEADGTRNEAYRVLVDAENLIDCMICTYYVGDLDGSISNFLGNNSPNNFYAIYNRNGQEGFQFFRHDAEHSLDTGAYDRTGPWPAGETFNKFNPQWLHQQLCSNEEYRLLFADRVQGYLFNDGLLTGSRAQSLLRARADEISLGVVAESARWGDAKRSTPRTRDSDWWPAVNHILYNYLPSRSSAVVSQFRAKGWYPSVSAPSFAQHGGQIDAGFDLSIDGSGLIYYTLDGSDPRRIGGAVSDTAIYYTGPVTLDDSCLVRARVLSGGRWSALNEAAFYVDGIPPVRITELMYNPGDPSAIEILAGFGGNNDFEFVEMQNISDDTVFLGGMKFTDGIRFTFPNVYVDPGKYVVVAKNEKAFLARYGGGTARVVGQYSGSLSDGGELLGLETALGTVLHEFEYNDAWYDATDGEGFSLNILDEDGELAEWDSKNGWYASTYDHGTPGGDDLGYEPGSVVINEVLAHSDGGVEDWIEIHNATDEDIDIGGWFLSDGPDDLMKYEIPAGTILHSGEHLVFDEVHDFGVGPDAFALSELGDDVYLSMGVRGRLAGYREHVDFGPSPNGVTVGLYPKAAGGSDFTLLTAPTMHGPNAAPRVGLLVLDELMFHPTDPPEGSARFDEDFEFIELYNRSAQTLDLTRFYLGGGVGFTFGWYDTDASRSAVWTLEAGASAAWTAELPQSGDWEVFVWLDNLDALGETIRLDSLARYEVNHAGGLTVVDVDQNVEAPQWVSLGTYVYPAGPTTVTLLRGALDPDERTFADRVKFVAGATEIVLDDGNVDAFQAAGTDVTTLAPGERIVLVSNLDAFDERYDVAANAIPVAGQYTGHLDNGGEKVKVFEEIGPDQTGCIPYLRSDYVNYKDAAPWPELADGTGSSIVRLAPGEYGNDAAHWNESNLGGTPGQPNLLLDDSPPVAPSGFEAAAVPGTQIDLSWQAAYEPDSEVHHYVVYRDGAVLLTTTETSYTDTDVTETETYVYEVSAVNRDAYEGERSEPVPATPLPTLRSAHGVDQLHVTVTFGKPLDPDSAQTAGNYDITDPEGQPVAVLSAALDAEDPAKVRLTLGEPLLGQTNYTLAVANVRDLAGNAVTAGSQTVFALRHVDPSLIAWWPFDEGTGETAIDATGNDRNLAISGATWEPEGRVRGALYFDGVDDSAVDEDGGAYINWLEAFTVAMWIRADETGTDRGFFTTRDPGSSDCLCLRHDVEGVAGGADETFKCYISTTGGNRYIEGEPYAQTADWQHVALSWASGGDLLLYLDGLLQTPSKTLGSVVGLLNSATQVVVGQGEMRNWPWKGLVDDVRIYNRQLTSGEIAFLMNAQPVGADDEYAAQQDAPLVVGAADGVLANDDDPDSGPEPLSAVLHSDPAHGELTLHADGSFEYGPDAGFIGADSFEYVPFDGAEYGDEAATVTLIVEATTAPTVPGNVVPTAVSPTAIDLEWDASQPTLSPVDHYVVYRDGEPVGTSATTTYSDTGLGETETYTYEVAAVSAAGHTSARSAPVPATPRPSVQAADGLDTTHIRVTFGKPVLAASAEVADNYDVRDDQDQPVPVAGAAQETEATVVLSLGAALADGEAYTVTVFNVADLTGNAVEYGSQVSFTFEDIDPALLVWWTFDEGGGTVATDASNHGREGQVIGAAWDPDGRIGGALRFDGVDDSVVDDDAEDYLTGLEAFTFAAWIRSEVTDTDRGFVTTRPPGTNQCFNARYDDDGHFGEADDVIKIYLQTDVGNYQYEGAGGTQTTEWQHVAVTWARGAEPVLYVDGAAQTFTHTSGAADGALADVTDLIVGKGYKTTNGAWQGLIDDVRIYARALDAGEAAALANLEPAPGDDAYELDRDTTLTVPAGEGVLANDADPDAGPQGLAAVLVGDVARGELTLQPDGSFEYSPPPGWHGTEQFTYQAFDGLEHSRTATVTLTILDTTPPTVTNFERNREHEEDKIGELNRVTLQFDQDVSGSLDLDDLVLHNDSTGLDVALAGAAFEYNPNRDAGVWDLSGTVVPPGEYTLTLAAAQVTSPYGVPLDGNGDGVGGDDYQVELLVALGGDTDLDGTVDPQDYLIIKRNYGRTSATWSQGDSDGDGDVDYDDYIAGRDNFGTSLSAGPVEVLDAVMAPAAAPTGAVAADPAPTDEAAPAAKTASGPGADSSAPVDLLAGRLARTRAHAGVSAATAPGSERGPIHAVGLLLARPARRAGLRRDGLIRLPVRPRTPAKTPHGGTPAYGIIDGLLNDDLVDLLAVPATACFLP